MRKFGFFSRFTIPKFCLDVSNILAADNVRIDTSLVHSPERQYFVKFRTDTWKLEGTASNAAAVYRSKYQANGCVFPRNEDEARAAVKRSDQARFTQQMHRLVATEFGMDQTSDAAEKIAAHEFAAGENEYDAVITFVTVSLNLRAEGGLDPVTLADAEEIHRVGSLLLDHIAPHASRGRGTASLLAEALDVIYRKAEGRPGRRQHNKGPGQGRFTGSRRRRRGRKTVPSGRGRQQVRAVVLRYLLHLEDEAPVAAAAVRKPARSEWPPN